MTNRSQAKIKVFAGLDVSARQISVARHRGQEQELGVASFAHSTSGHKALVAYLLREPERARVCLEASGHYSLDLALTLQAHPPYQGELGEPSPRTPLCGISRGAEQNRSGRCSCALRICRAHALAGLAASELAGSTLASHYACHRGLGSAAHPRKKSCPCFGQQPSFAGHGFAGKAASSALSGASHGTAAARSSAAYYTESRTGSALSPNAHRSRHCPNQCPADPRGVSRTLRYAACSPVGRF